MNNDSFIYWDKYSFSTRTNFTQDFNKDKNSEFILLDKVDPNIADKITNSYDYKELRKILVDDEDEEKKSHKSHSVLISIVVILIIILVVAGIIIYFKFIRNNKKSSSIDKLEKINDSPLVEND